MVVLDHKVPGRENMKKEKEEIIKYHWPEKIPGDKPVVFFFKIKNIQR